MGRRRPSSLRGIWSILCAHRSPRGGGKRPAETAASIFPASQPDPNPMNHVLAFLTRTSIGLAALGCSAPVLAQSAASGRCPRGQGVVRCCCFAGHVIGPR